MKKVLSAMLCFCMLISILPTTAFATNITIFNVTVNEPKIGETLSYEASVPESASTYVSKVEWNGELDASEKVMPGKYEVRVTVRIKEGMDDKYIKVPSKDTVKVNGESAKLQEVSDDKKQAVVVYTFRVGETAAESGEADASKHKHCYCGGYIENVGDHTSHSDVTYTKWSGGNSIPYKNCVAYIYLDKDVALDNTLSIGGDKTLYLCLNGHALSMKYRGQRVININVGGKLYLCNCTRAATGQITKGNAEYGAGIHNNGTVRMFGGVITENDGGYGGGVYNNGNFILYGGDLYNNKALYGGGLWNDNEGEYKFIMYEGTISLNVANGCGGGIYNNSYANLVLKGGTVDENVAGTGGGALWNNGGNVELDGAMLLGNLARYGGGVWNNGGGIFEIKSGNISKNIAGDAPDAVNGYGGGVWNNDKGIIHMTGGEITFNFAALGGGVWCNPNSEFMMSDGVVAENQANFGGGIYVSSQGSHVASYKTPPAPGRFRITNRAGILMNIAHQKGGGAYVEGILEFEGEGAIILNNCDAAAETAEIFEAEGAQITKNEPMPTQFVDVARDAYYIEPVKWAIENGITNGTSEITFSPDDTCNTAQILTFLWRAAGSPTVTDHFPFADVYESDYFYMAAQWAKKKGLVEHYALYPNFSCSRLTAVYYIWCAAGKPECKTQLQFTDVKDPGSESYEAVAWAVENGIVNGTTATTFSPGNSCTRAQIVTFLWRAAQKGFL